LRCPMAEQIAQWVRDDVAPAVLKLGAPVRGLDNFDSYECRGRNRVRGATISEHGRADALDVRLFKLADGRDLVLTDVNVDKAWREAIKASACARFSTVLGPGSDGNHEEHIHLDLAERHNNYKVCEWDVRTPPPPPAQAEAAPPADATAAPADEAPAQDDAAAAPPLETVPLPRPRPRHLVNAGEDGSAPPKKSDRN
jgi:extensin-like protein